MTDHAPVPPAAPSAAPAQPAQPSQFALLRQRRFLPFFLTQFCGAFNDNLYKNALVVLFTFQAAQMTSLQPAVLVNLAGGIFILPFFLFSATCGQIADKFEKSRLIRFTKLLEIAVMGLGAVAFALHSLPLMLGTLFLMGAQSTLFGPVKYAILPQTLREHELIGGNALVEAGTFVSILIGTIAGGLLVAAPDGTRWVSGAVLAVAALGYLASREIPTAPAASPQLAINWNPVTETVRNLRFLRTNRTVFLAIIGGSWFWFVGALFLAQFPDYAVRVLGGTETSVTLLLTVFSIGIGLGSLLCEKLSGGTIEIGLVPLGSIGLTLAMLDFWWATPAAGTLGSGQALGAVLSHGVTWRVLLDLLLIGAFGGFYIVPLYALIQSRSDAAHRSRVIAGNNIVNAMFMVVAALFGAGMVAAGATIADIVLVTVLCNAAVALYIYLLVPEFLIRFAVWAGARSLWPVRVRGLGSVPRSGAALLVASGLAHSGDALRLFAASPRPLRVLLPASLPERLLSHRLLFRANAITGHDPAAHVIAARQLDAGHVVAIVADDSAHAPAVRAHARNLGVPVYEVRVARDGRTVLIDGVREDGGVEAA